MQKSINKIPSKKSLPHLAQDPMLESIKLLEAKIETLGAICNEINPYAEISDEQKMKLMNFNIVDFHDPFKITNQLLMLLEDAIDELHKLKPLSPEEIAKELF